MFESYCTAHANRVKFYTHFSFMCNMDSHWTFGKVITKTAGTEQFQVNNGGKNVNNASLNKGESGDWFWEEESKTKADLSSVPDVERYRMTISDPNSKLLGKNLKLLI